MLNTHRGQRLGSKWNQVKLWWLCECQNISTVLQWFVPGSHIVFQKVRQCEVKAGLWTLLIHVGRAGWPVSPLACVVQSQRKTTVLQMWEKLDGRRQSSHCLPVQRLKELQWRRKHQTTQGTNLVSFIYHAARSGSIVYPRKTWQKDHKGGNCCWRFVVKCSAWSKTLSPGIYVDVALRSRIYLNVVAYPAYCRILVNAALQ